MRLIDADKINLLDVIGGQSDFARDVRKAVQEVIDKQPTLDVEPVRHGEWINTHDRYVKCSLCGKSVQTNWRGFYCQNCGAKEDGGSEE